jgi:hypothetical protein
MTGVPVTGVADDWTVSSHRRACFQQLTAGPGAACGLAACPCRDQGSEQDQGPGRPGRIGLAFLIAGDDSRPRI